MMLIVSWPNFGDSTFFREVTRCHELQLLVSSKLDVYMQYSKKCIIKLIQFYSRCCSITVLSVITLYNIESTGRIYNTINFHILFT